MGGCCLFNGCPCARPEIILTRNNTSIGRITNPYRCMGRNGNHCAWEELDIIDDKGNIKYMISSSCCQSGQICRYFLESKFSDHYVCVDPFVIQQVLYISEYLMLVK